MALSDEFDGFPAPPVEFVPSIPPNLNFDASIVEELKSSLLHSTPVNNGFLKMKPEDIPLHLPGFFESKSFYVDDLCILTDDKIDTTDGECWKKLGHERGQGWGIADDFGWTGWKRTFVYEPSQPSESNKNWFMEVYAVLEADGYLKPLYWCHVSESYNCKQRLKCVRQLSPADVDIIQRDLVEDESLAKQLEAIATNSNLLPYVERSLADMFCHNTYAWLPSIGVDKSLRAEVWKSGKFSRIKARRRDGSEINWSLCNHCGMVYKGTTLPAALGKHKCDCSCRLAPNS